jgi:hypothetical protein
MATVAQLEAALMKADAAGDDAAAREIAAEIKRVRAVQPSAQPKSTPVGMGTALGKGFARGLSDVSDTLVKAAANVVDRFGVSPAEAVAWAAENVSGYSKADAAKIANNLTELPNFQTIVEAGSQANKARDAAVQAERPYSYGGGRIAGQVFGTAPIPVARATPEAHRTFLQADIAKWRPLIQAAGQFAD